MLHVRTRLQSKSIHLQTIITWACILIFFLPLIAISIYCYQSLAGNVYGTMQKDIRYLVSKSEESIASQIDTVVSTYYNIISDPILNPELYGTISGTTPYTEDNVTDKIISERLAKIMMYNIAWSKNLIKSVTYYNKSSHYNLVNGNSFLNLSEELKQELEEIHDTYAGQGNDSPRICKYVYSKYNNNIIYYVRDYHRPNTLSGGLVIFQIDTAKLSDSYHYFDKYEGFMGLLSIKDGTILASTDTELNQLNINTITVNDIPFTKILNASDDYYTQMGYLEAQELYSTIILPMQPLHKQLHDSLRAYLILLILSSFVIFLICISIPRYFSSYVNLLIQKMDNIRHRNYNIQLPNSPITELSNLNQNFNYMSSEIQRLIHEVYENGLLVKDAQIKLLQAQINPHFLFNILLCISWKARANHDDEVYNMVTTLSSLMRFNIYTDDNQKSTIKKELEISRLYLELQRYRFGEHLNYEFCVDENISSCLIPKLTIQTLVENAVVHGIEKKLEPGIVRITVKSVEDEVQVIVYDNGVGCTLTDPGQIESCEENQTHFQVGLKNCHKRIRHLYGDKYGLTIDSVLQSYTCVTIHIPIEHEEE